ncbi:hypothetical protein ACQJBY_072608 [Aegilops geniculata]
MAPSRRRGSPSSTRPRSAGASGSPSKPEFSMDHVCNLISARHTFLPVSAARSGQGASVAEAEKTGLSLDSFKTTIVKRDDKNIHSASCAPLLLAGAHEAVVLLPELNQWPLRPPAVGQSGKSDHLLFKIRQIGGGMREKQVYHQWQDEHHATPVQDTAQRRHRRRRAAGTRLQDSF